MYVAAAPAPLVSKLDSKLDNCVNGTYYKASDFSVLAPVKGSHHTGSCLGRTTALQLADHNHHRRCAPQEHVLAAHCTAKLASSRNSSHKSSSSPSLPELEGDVLILLLYNGAKCAEAS